MLFYLRPFIFIHLHPSWVEIEFEFEFSFFIFRLCQFIEIFFCFPFSFRFLSSIKIIVQIIIWSKFNFHNNNDHHHKNQWERERKKMLIIRNEWNQRPKWKTKTKQWFCDEHDTESKRNSCDIWKWMFEKNSKKSLKQFLWPFIICKRILFHLFFALVCLLYSEKNLFESLSYSFGYVILCHHHHHHRRKQLQELYTYKMNLFLQNSY